jgi:RHS repeat-associated protein
MLGVTGSSQRVRRAPGRSWRLSTHGRRPVYAPWRRVTAILASFALLTGLLVVASESASAADRLAVTSYDRIAPGAPHNGTFTSAWQSFVAESDTLTTLAVTVGTPNYVPDGHTVLMRLCTDTTCSTKLAEAAPQIANYGTTQADVGDVSVNPGQIYYIVWYQPASWNGQSWVTFWWGSGSTIGNSDQMQAAVRGYNRGTVVDRMAITSYTRMQPGAPYNGYFINAWQPFVAGSNTITSLGVTVGSSGYVADGHTVLIRLCGDTNCNTKYAETQPQIVNYGNSQGDIGDVSVTPGATYYIVYYQPAAWQGHTWNTYWWTGGPSISQSDQMQAIVQGYNRSAPVIPTYHVFGTGGVGLKERSGPGLTYSYGAILPEGRSIQISCQLRTGSSVGGSTIWDQLTDGTYVSDFYTDTPAYNGFTPGLSQCASSPLPITSSAAYQVFGTQGLGLKLRTGPGMNYPSTGALPEGAAVPIACQWRSASMANGSTIWDELNSGLWVADGFLNTPGKNQFTAGIPQCSSAPAAPTYEYPVTQSYGRPGTTSTGHNPTSVTADPVNTLTGAYWTQDSDLKLTGIGVPFNLSRSYTSANQAVGPMGPGWMQNYDQALVFTDKGDVTFVSDQGAQLAFQLQSTGVFAGPPGVDAQLRQVAGSGFEVIEHDQTHLTFDTVGRLLAMLDRNGQGLHFTHDASGQLTDAIDSAGRDVTFTYDSASHLRTSARLPDGRTVKYAYTSGLLTSVTDPENAVSTYGYDAAGHLTKAVDGNGHTRISNTYGPDARVVSQTDALGNVSTFAWDAASQTSTMTDARGGIWKDAYTNNVLTSRVDADGNTTTYTYDGDLNLVGATDPRGNANGATAANYTTAYTYDERGNRLTETAPAPLNYVKTWTYDVLNDVTAATDGRGNTTNYSYDAAGNRTSMTQPGGNVTTYGRDPAGTGLLVSQSDPRGSTTTYAYDSAGDKTKITTPLGEITTMTYDQSGRLASRVDPRGNVSGATPASYTTSFSYDGDDRLTMTVDALGMPTSYGYDAVGNKTAVVDANLHSTRYAYDGADHLIRVDAPQGASTTYQYDATGNVKSRADYFGHVTTNTYDAANRLTSTVDPLGRTTSYAYDPAGNRTLVTDARGIATTNTYDALNRLTSAAYSDGTASVVTTYDANGNRTAMTDGAGAQSNVYDTLDRLTTSTRGSSAFTYAYDSAGHITGRTYPGQPSILYSYDADGRLSQVATSGAATNYTYDAAGNETTMALPTANGYTETKTYDADGRISKVATTKGTSTLNTATYTRDAVGNPTKVIGTAGTVSYVYDGANRLTKVCFTTACTADSSYIKWTYDGLGNRLTEQRKAAVTVSYTYDAADELTASSDGVTTTAYGYDAAGNQTQAGSKTWTYDATNHLKSATSGTTTTTFLTDGDGNRVRQTAGSTVTNYAWDGNNALPQLAMELNGSNTLLRRYTYGSKVFSESTPTATYYLTGDALGSITGVSSATGIPLINYTYEPFGTTKTTTNLTTKGLPSSEPMRFNGQFLDGLATYDLRAREYDPTRGRFQAVDPVATKTGDPAVSSYAYASDQPTTLVDPSGKFVQFIIIAYEVANLASTSVSCWYGSQTYASGYGQEFQQDCIVGLLGGSVELRAVQALARYGKYVPDLLGYLYDAATGLYTKITNVPAGSPQQGSPSGRPIK